MERDTLRLLCSNLIRPITRVELSGLLDPSLFDDPLHRTVLEEIAALGPVPPARLRELLPARITNRGFPDFNLNEFLGRDQATEDEIEKLFRSVLQMIELRHRDDGSVPEA
ncbi:MAG TPA: hypothetical protein VGI13_15020 [Candidatus Acidoferrum sp.]|jgi:hypothetical protein